MGRKGEGRKGYRVGDWFSLVSISPRHVDDYRWLSRPPLFPLRCTLYTCYLFSRAPFHPLPTGNTGEFVPTFPYCRCRLDRGRKTMTAPLEKNREPWIFPFFFAPPSSPSHSPSRNSLVLPFVLYIPRVVGPWVFVEKKKKRGERIRSFFFFPKENHRRVSNIREFGSRIIFDLSIPSIFAFLKMCQVTAKHGLFRRGNKNLYGR